MGLRLLPTSSTSALDEERERRGDGETDNTYAQNKKAGSGRPKPALK